MTSLYSHDKAGNSGEWYCCFHAIVINLETQTVGLARLSHSGHPMGRSKYVVHSQRNFVLILAGTWSNALLPYLAPQNFKPFTIHKLLLWKYFKIISSSDLCITGSLIESAYRFPNRVIKILVFFNKASFLYSKFETILVFM